MNTMQALGQRVLGVAVLGWALLGLVACGGGSSSSTVPLVSSATLSGVVVAAGNDPVAGVTVNLYFLINQADLLGELLTPLTFEPDPGLSSLSAAVGQSGENTAQALQLPAPVLVASTQTNGVGRFSFADLDYGLYDVEFDVTGSSHSGLAPLRFGTRPHLDDDVLDQLQAAGLLNNDPISHFMTVFLPPIVGSVDIVSNIVGTQTLTFDDGMGADPLPGLSLFVPAGLQVVKDGVPLADGASTTLALSLVAPEQVPTSFRDDTEKARTNQLFFSLQPVGVEFVVPGSYDPGLGFGTPALVQVTYPNVNGLAPGASVDLYRFEHENPVDPTSSFRWVAAGTGTVDGTGALVVPDAGAGLPEAGWHAAPGPPPPTVTVDGDLKLVDGSILAQAGVAVVTNNGAVGFSDAAGHFSIVDVPIIGGQTQLICRAFTDGSLVSEMATSAPQPVSFPITTCDVVLSQQGAPVDTVAPTVASTLPAADDVAVPTDAPVSVTFDELIDGFTLPANLLVTAGAQGPAVTGKVIPQLMAPGQTRAVFVPDAALLPNTLYTVTVATGVADLNGNGLAGSHVFSFTTGAAALGTPQVFSMSPERGPAGTLVEILGVNLGNGQVSFDGGMVPLSPGATSTAFSFVVPTLANVGAGPKPVDISDSSMGGAMLAQLTFGLTPSVTSLTPSSGLVGTTVVIAGNNFATDGSNGSVTFNSVPAMVSGAGMGDDAQTVTVDVPAGASSGAVVVTVASGLASAPRFFAVTAAVDSTAPTLVSSVPADQDMQVPLASTIAVTLSELVREDSTITVMQDGGFYPPAAVVGTTLVSGDGAGQGLLTFTPDVSFLYGAVITVASDTMEDLAGNPVVPFSFQFFSETLFLTQDTPDLQLETAGQGASLDDLRVQLKSARDDEDGSAADADKADFLLAFLGYATSFDHSGAPSSAEQFRDLLDALVFPEHRPDLFDLLSDLDVFTRPAPLPVDGLGCNELRRFYEEQAIPTLTALVHDLQALPPSLELTFVSRDGLAHVEIDATDVLGWITLFNKSLVDMHHALAFGCATDGDGGSGTPATVRSPADLMLARQYAGDMAASYSLAIDSLMAEGDDQSDDLITFEPGSDADENQAKAATLNAALRRLSDPSW